MNSHSQKEFDTRTPQQSVSVCAVHGDKDLKTLVDQDVSCAEFSIKHGEPG